MPERRPDPPPLETDDVRIVAVGTVLWTVALLVLLPFWSRLSRDHHLWWVATCACGALLGLAGLRYVVRRRAAIRRGQKDPEDI